MAEKRNVQEKMETDYLWIRNNALADNAPLPRTHGQHYIYNTVPNYYQRIQMTYRSLGQQYDWELQKFRLQKKSVDKGNKKRFFKNVFRFIKNPVGYIAWKKVHFSGRISFLYYFAIGALVSTLFKYKKTEVLLSKKNLTDIVLGKNSENLDNQKLGYNDQKFYFLIRMYRTMTSLSFMRYVQAYDFMVVTSPSWKQNFRKQLSTFKAYNVAF